MDIRIYSVLDTKTQRYMVPWYLHSDVEAVRHFTTLTNTDSTQIHANPSDYELYAIGVWNDETSETILLNQHVVSASSLVKQSHDTQTLTSDDITKLRKFLGKSQ